MKKKIVIAGGTGFIGGALIKHFQKLLKFGYKFEWVFIKDAFAEIVKNTPGKNYQLF